MSALQKGRSEDPSNELRGVDSHRQRPITQLGSGRSCARQGRISAQRSHEVANASRSWLAGKICCARKWPRFRTRPWASYSAGRWRRTTSRSASALNGRRCGGWACVSRKPSTPASKSGLMCGRRARCGVPTNRHSIPPNLSFSTKLGSRPTWRVGRGAASRTLACRPQCHWKTTTFLAGLRHDGLIVPLVLDGPIDGESFLAYVEQLLVPTLSLRPNRHHGQPPQPQSPGRLPSHRGHRRQPTLLAVLFAGL